MQCKEENLKEYGQECDNYVNETIGEILDQNHTISTPALQRGGVIALVGSPDSWIFWFFLLLSIGGSCLCCWCRRDDKEQVQPAVDTAADNEH